MTALIRAERHDARRYAVLLILAPRHRLAPRWAALKMYHQAQATRWENAS